MIPLLPVKPVTFGDLQEAAVIYYHTGDQQRAQQYLDQLIDLANEESENYSSVAAALVQMDQPDRAIEYLEKALEEREVVFHFIRIDPDFQPLHDDPRYLDILERAGLEPPPSK
jgi:tetratricopeptide (TPR) repeat protein